MDHGNGEVDTAVVGGGLGGLAAAALVARAGRTVALFERSGTLGGRADTHDHEGFLFNVGPHALYRAGEGLRVLASLGIRPQGGVPGVSGGYAVAGGRAHALPGGFLSLLTTSLFGVGAKLETARLLVGLGRIDPAGLERLTLQRWIEREIRHPDVRALLAALARLSTYAHCPERLSAAAALRQIQLALAKSVLYVDGGWRSLVEVLRERAEAAGARIVTGAAVERLRPDGGGYLLSLRDGSTRRAATVVVALPLAAAADLLDDLAPEIRRFASEAVPVRAACLDVALSRLPRPNATFALGIDRPLYLSVHSAVAKLAPAGGATIHVAKYLEPGRAADARADERELEGLLDLVQPGWRDAVVERRFLPQMLVASAAPAAATGGLAGRPPVTVPGHEGLCLAGDWVGPEGLLADATLASARAAAAHLARGAKERAAA